MKYLVLVLSLLVANLAKAEVVTEDACNINAHEGEVCDYEVKKLQALATEGTVIKCTKIQTPTETKYVVEVPKDAMGPVIYDVKVNESGSQCTITQLTAR